MKLETKKTLKNAACVAGSSVLSAAVGTAAYVFGHKPVIVENPCFRSCHRADGRPKKAFNKPWKANWQSVIQFLKYGELCNPYQVGDKYYTGHSSKNSSVIK